MEKYYRCYGKVFKMLPIKKISQKTKLIQKHHFSFSYFTTNNLLLTSTMGVKNY